MDSFENCPPAAVAEAKATIYRHIQESCGDTARLVITEADTMSLKPADIKRQLNTPLSFISVDAGHEAANLLNDIGLAADLLGAGGVIAVDDAFNHSTPGAIEGTCRFFEETKQRCSVVAFTHCYNKLFLCQLRDHGVYLELCKKFVYERAHLDYCHRTLQRMRENELSRFVPRFYGIEMLPFL